MRWRLPEAVPAALYMQWVGEDTRQGGSSVGSWLRMAGIEAWGSVGTVLHRSHVEVAETSCRAGGFGFSELISNCAYEHSIYRTGYRYLSRPLGHGMDADGLSYSIGSTLVQSPDHSWNLVIRFMQINRIGSPQREHSLSAEAMDRLDVQTSWHRTAPVGRYRIGLGYGRVESASADSPKSEISGFISWSSR